MVGAQTLGAMGGAQTPGAMVGAQALGVMVGAQRDRPPDQSASSTGSGRHRDTDGSPRSKSAEFGTRRSKIAEIGTPSRTLSDFAAGFASASRTL